MMSYSKEYIDRFISELNEDDIKYLKEKINEVSDKKSKYLEFIKLNKKAYDLIYYLKRNKPDTWSDIAWHRLFSDEFYNKAYKLYPFHYCDIDSSYEDEIFWLMIGWDDAVKQIKQEMEIDGFLEEFEKEYEGF